MSGGKVFFDTNVLLYIYGGTDNAKRRLARNLFSQSAASSRILVSTQVVQEFYVAGSRKLGMPRQELEAATQALLELPLVIIEAEHIRSAMQWERQYQISFWDALILTAAESGGAELVYTEDLNDGQRYGGVTVRNPFRPASV